MRHVIPFMLIYSIWEKWRFYGLIFNFFIFAISIQLSGQTKGLYFHHLRTAQGLSQASNAYVFHDSRGFIWISSPNGLNRFDGIDVTVYHPNKRDTNSLWGQSVNSHFFESKNGDIWFTTNGSIHRYNRKKNNFSNRQIEDPKGFKLKYDYLAFYLQKDSILWVRIGDNKKGQLYQYNTKSGSYSKLGPLWGNRFLVDTTKNNHTIVIYSYFYGPESPLYQTTYSNGQIKRDSFFDGKKFPKSKIHDIILEKDTFWIVGNFGLASFLPHKKYWHPFKLGNNLPANAIATLNEHIFTISTNGGGLIFFDRHSKKTSSTSKHNPQNPNSISGNILNDIYLDPYHTLWISDWNDGLSYWSTKKDKVQNLILNDLPIAPESSSIIKILSEDRLGNIWCGTSKRGIIIFDKTGSFKQQIYGNKGLPKTTVYFLYCTPGGIMMAVTPDGIFWYDEQPGRFRLVIGSDSIDEGIWEKGIMRQTIDGRLLFFFTKLYELKKINDTDGFRIQELDELGVLKNSFVPFWYQDKEGHFYFNVNDNITITISATGKIDTLDGIINLKACFEDKERKDIIWLATSYGLARMNKLTLKYTLFDEPNNLPNQYLYGVTADKAGYLWLSSNRGIIRFNPINNRANSIGLADGVWENEFYSDAWLAASNGQIWFGNRDVINIIHPTQFQLNSTIPKIQITDFWVNDQPIKDSIYIGECNEKILPFSQNTFSFKFLALEYSDPLNNQLWYRLDGHDPDSLWLSVRKGSPGFARYAKLPPGTYTFQIRAANSDGIKNPYTRKFRIVILKPFYFQWWFITLIISILFLIVYGIHEYRLIQERKVFSLKEQTMNSEMKALRAQMRPHFIFNCINSINSFLVDQRFHLASTYLVNVADVIQDVLLISSKEIIDLEREIEFLKAYLEVETLRLDGKLTWVINVSDDLDTFDIKVPSMVIQPFVENAIKHGIFHKPGKGSVKISIREGGNYIIIEVEDDGIGRAASALIGLQEHPRRESLGIAITNDRLAIYGRKNNIPCNAEIQDLKDSNDNPLGTKVIIKIMNRS